MSEFINNIGGSPRVNKLLEFLKRVHEGEDQKAIREEYEAGIHAGTPSDVLIIEDPLLKNGVSHTEVKETVEPIMETLAPTVQAHEWDRPNKGHPIDNSRRENRSIESHLETIS